ncbi:type III secretion system cytoplasmic ring protein SctQ [Spongorhabdus nitratireducens]
MAAARSLPLPRLATEQVRLDNLICRHGEPFDLQLGKHHVEVRLQPAGPSHDYKYRIDFQQDDTTQSLRLSEQCFDLILPGKLTAENAVKMPEELMLAALSYSFDQALGQLAQTLGIQFAIQNAGTDQQHHDAAEAGVLLEIRTDEGFTSGFLTYTPLLEKLLEQMPAAAAGWQPDITVPVYCRAGESTINGEELKSLGTGDIVLMSHCDFEDESTVKVSIANHLLFDGSLSGNTITLGERVHNAMEESEEMASPEEALEAQHEMVDDMEHMAEESAAEAPVNLSELPVQLTFDIGHKEISLDELQRCRPGMTFELDRDAESPVIIRANGKIIAECELVQVNRHIGARITRMRS